MCVVDSGWFGCFEKPFHSIAQLTIAVAYLFQLFHFGAIMKCIVGVVVAALPLMFLRFCCVFLCKIFSLQSLC